MKTIKIEANIATIAACFAARVVSKFMTNAKQEILEVPSINQTKNDDTIVSNKINKLQETHENPVLKTPKSASSDELKYLKLFFFQ